jgi:hypothetical protein
MTSNLGSAEIFQHMPSDSKADLKTRVMEHVKAHFRPEFINRVDEFIVFEPLVREQIRDIVGLRAAALVERVARQRLQMRLTDSALEYLASKVRGGIGLDDARVVYEVGKGDMAPSISPRTVSRLAHGIGAVWKTPRTDFYRSRLIILHIEDSIA